MTSTLDLDHLRSLVAIADCGGFNRAAAARHLSQPALSAHVRGLERDLKRRLFERHGRTMRLTSEGERVLAEARRLLAAHDAMLDRLDAAPHRRVVVGSTEHSAQQVLPEMLAMLRQAFPGVDTRFRIGRSTALAEATDRGEIDVAFILNPGDEAPGREVGRLDLRWYCAPGWTPPTGAEPWSLVAFEEPCRLRERALAALGAGPGREVRVTAQSTTLEGVLAGVRAGLGIALLPSSGATPDGLAVRNDLPDCGSVGLHLVTRRGLDRTIETLALDATATFFAERPHLQLLPA